MLVVDEVAELFLVASRKDGERRDEMVTQLIRLAQLGRAAGIYLEICDQRFGAELGKGATMLRAAFVLAIAMGLRRGEVLGLRWSDVDLDKRVIRIGNQVQRIGGELYQDTTKTGKIRPVPLPLICLAALRWHRLRLVGAPASNALVFTTRTGRPIEPRNLNRSFSRLTAAAGLRPIRLHDARHGCATLLTAAGVAPRVLVEILGHSQISMTMDVYTHVAQDTQREAISHMDRLLKRRLSQD
ncbi:tyrosine-type recombinase/integrase [Streptomyces sp. NPDC048636]|uniref:tyrosine-type recombinase/integrase n=1 Tax=Streptomyces sp. NPDC048636 TaxID=3155762 RepID=UPI00342570C1